MKQLVFIFIFCISGSSVAEIAPEKIGVIESLPDSYPPHWIIAQDASFFHMSDGKFIVLDADSDDPAGRYKGMFNGSFIAQFYQARTKPEMYIVESFRSRGNRGERTDVLSIYDKSTLAPIGEIVIPPKRASEMPTQYNLQLVDNESLALVYNFTPAASVSVVDVGSREFLGEVPIPGCALVYPMSGRAFASLCGDGTMLSVQLEDSGVQATTARTEPFFDVDNDPLMERPAIQNGVAYFLSFLGSVYPVDLSGPAPQPAVPWSMLGDDDGGWRPGGMQSAAIDAKGRLYVLMHSHGAEGTHKDPGTEVWVFDTNSQSRVERIELQQPAVSIAVTRDDSPLLVATNINMEIDVYDIVAGNYVRTLGDFGQETPLLLHGAY
jgi:methylamine dehydrogenase heavy chain